MDSRYLGDVFNKQSVILPNNLYLAKGVYQAEQGGPWFVSFQDRETCVTKLKWIKNPEAWGHMIYKVCTEPLIAVYHRADITLSRQR
jgi:hypothetical protein